MKSYQILLVLAVAGLGYIIYSVTRPVGLLLYRCAHCGYEHRRRGDMYLHIVEEHGYTHTTEYFYEKVPNPDSPGGYDIVYLMEGVP